MRIVKFRRNYGQTQAMMAGIDVARGKVLVTMDGDLQNDPRDIPRFLEQIEAGHDLVVGWRKDRKDHWSRVLPSKVANRLIGWVTGVPINCYHGGLARTARDKMIAEFQERPGAGALVLSLKAGGTGLNLTAANHVVLYDRWWNPAVEDQASDRAHRIGQQRRVQVHLLVTMGTLEERIDRLLESKRGLADAVVSGGEAWLGSLSTDELRALVSLGSDATVESIEAWDDT